MGVRSLQPPSQPGRARLGCHEAAPCQLADPDHAGASAGGARLLPLPDAGSDDGYRLPLQHALATAGLRTEVVEGCFSAEFTLANMAPRNGAASSVQRPSSSSDSAAWRWRSSSASS